MFSKYTTLTDRSTKTYKFSFIGDMKAKILCMRYLLLGPHLNKFNSFSSISRKRYFCILPVAVRG